MKGSYVHQSKKDPLGTLEAGTIKVPAFGPQKYPLTGPHLLEVIRDEELPSFAFLHEDPEIWLQISELPSLEVKFFGLKVETPLAFVFYVQANQAVIGNNSYFSKTLQRYQGPAEKISFFRNESKWTLENQYPYLMELIPLSGEGSFWNSDFLLAFEVPVYNPRVCFQMEICE